MPPTFFVIWEEESRQRALLEQSTPGPLHSRRIVLERMEHSAFWVTTIASSLVFSTTVSNGTRGVVGDVDAGTFAPVDFAVDESGVGFAREARAVVFTGNVAVSKGSFGFVRDDETIATGARERATFD